MIETLRRGVPPPRMPRVGLALRLRTSPLVRAFVPKRVSVLRATRRGRAAWEHDRSEREDALEAMAAVIDCTPRAHELPELARARLIERRVEAALFWHPWHPARLDPRSRALLCDTNAAGRGMLLSHCHLGAQYRAMPALEAIGYQPYSVVGSWILEQPSRDEWGRRLARWRKGGNRRMVSARGSFPTLLALLERGEIVSLAFDVPGTRTTRFLGKATTLADGTARLAIEADAPILPLRSVRTGTRYRVEVSDPLDPREHPGLETLQEALAAVHERWILGAPATLEDRRGIGWAPAPARSSEGDG